MGAVLWGRCVNYGSFGRVYYTTIRLFVGQNKKDDYVKKLGLFKSIVNRSDEYQVFR